MTTAGSIPPVTVAVPTIGRLKYLPPLRASLAAQTMGDFEILVLDNASPPAARDAFADWARDDARVRILRVEPQIEMFANFNRGYTNARGKYLLFFHDDDVYSPRFVEEHFRLFEREPRVAFSGTNNDFIDDENRVISKRRLIKETGVMRGHDYIEFVMRTGRNLVPMQSVGYRVSALAPNGIDASLSCYWGDFVLMMRMAETHDVGLIAEPLLKLRRHEQQYSVTDYRENGNRGTNGAKAQWLQADVFGGRARMLRGYLDEYRARWPFDTAFIATLERALRRSTRKGSIWGWFLAQDEEDARRCLDILGDSRLDAELQALLRRVDGLGFDAHLRSTYIAPFVRRVGGALRF